MISFTDDNLPIQTSLLSFLKEGEKMITIKNVNKKFMTKNGPITAVDNVNIEISEGEIFGVIGYSGAGKSTLIRLLNGLEIPTSGTIYVADQEISNIQGTPLREARQEIGMIFQHFNLLWSRTVNENIAFPLEIAGVSKAKRKKRVEELIQLVGLDGRDDAYPSELSGGQKQRVGIARALANNPKALLSDEATSALDPETTDSILDLLVDINKRLGLTIVLITHEMYVIQKICDRVAVMEDGKVVEIGDVIDVFKNPQQEITRRFVKQMTEKEDTKQIFDIVWGKYPNGKIIKLTYIGDNTTDPIITNLIRNYQLDVTILHGNVSQTKEGPYGTLFIHVDGDQEKLNQAINYLQDEQLSLEVITANDG